MVHLQLAPDLRQFARVGGIDQVGNLVQQAKDLVKRRHPRLVGGVQLGELLDRVEEVVQGGDEGKHHTGRGMAVDRLDAADHQDLHGDQRGQQLHHREVGRVQVHRPHVGRPVLLVELAEPGHVSPLLGERPDHADAGQRLLQVAGDRGDLLPGQAIGVRRSDPEGDPAHQQERQDDERQQGQVRIHHEQDHHHADQRQS